MKTKILSALVFATALGLSLPIVSVAQENPQDHEKHHPAAAKPGAANSVETKGSEESGMQADGMGSMDMEGMHEMMKECMQSHKDGKMCNHQTMQKCEEKMGTKECKKMMGQMKKEEKTTK